MTTLELTLAKNIRKKRKERGLTGLELSALLGCVKSNITNWETARNMPTVWYLCLLADEFECSVDELLGRTTPNSKED